MASAEVVVLLYEVVDSVLKGCWKWRLLELGRRREGSRWEDMVGSLEAAVMVVELGDLMKMRLGGFRGDRAEVCESLGQLRVQKQEHRHDCLILMDQPPPKLGPASVIAFFDVAGWTLEEGEELEQVGWDENASSNG